MFARIAAREDVSGPIASDTVWDAATTRVVGDVEILAGATLTVAAGVRVEFAGHQALRVGGRLLAIGTAAAPIVFTLATPAETARDGTFAGGWNGLRFEATPATGGVSRLEHCVIEHARAEWGQRGVGPLVVVHVSALQVVNCVFRHNEADHGAAVFCVQGSSPELAGCLFTDNRAFTGGAAVFCVDAYPRLVGCTIADNHDLNAEPFAEAAALMSYFGKPRTTGCILWGNTTHYFEPAQSWQTKPFCTTWSDLEGGHAGAGNLAADPRFGGVGEHPYALAAGSPCLDKGPLDPAGWPAEDLAGQSRPQHGRLDIGAYELAVDTAAPMSAPFAARLAPPCPNPGNPQTTITFWLPASAHVNLQIYDLRGRCLRSLVDATMPAGACAVTWRGDDDAGRGVAAGTYCVRLGVNGRSHSQPLSLVR